MLTSNRFPLLKMLLKFTTFQNMEKLEITVLNASKMTDAKKSLKIPKG